MDVHQIAILIYIKELDLRKISFEHRKKPTALHSKT